MPAPTHGGFILPSALSRPSLEAPEPARVTGVKLGGRGVKSLHPLTPLLPHRKRIKNRAHALNRAHTILFYLKIEIFTFLESQDIILFFSCKELPINSVMLLYNSLTIF